MAETTSSASTTRQTHTTTNRTPERAGEKEISDEADALGAPGRDKDWELAEEAVKQVRTPQ